MWSDPLAAIAQTIYFHALTSKGNAFIVFKMCHFLFLKFIFSLQTMIELKTLSVKTVQNWLNNKDSVWTIQLKARFSKKFNLLIEDIENFIPKIVLEDKLIEEESDEDSEEEDFRYVGSVIIPNGAYVDGHFITFTLDASNDKFYDLPYTSRCSGFKCRRRDYDAYCVSCNGEPEAIDWPIHWTLSKHEFADLLGEIGNIQGQEYCISQPRLSESSLEKVYGLLDDLERRKKQLDVKITNLKTKLEFIQHIS